jgi:predicted GIY-YIG superfamily endonuclease
MIKMKYVYLIQSLENSYYKIGVSKHPQKRLKQNQTGNPSPTKLIEVYQSEFANQIEKIIQRRYAYLRKEGEWFDLSIAEEVSFIENCKDIENTIIFLRMSNNVFI